MPVSAPRQPLTPAGPREAADADPCGELFVAEAAGASLGPFPGQRLPAAHDWEPVGVERQWGGDFMRRRRVGPRLDAALRKAAETGTSFAAKWRRAPQQITTAHSTVMANEVAWHLGCRKGRRGTYADFTFGGGGHSRAILEASDGDVVGIDCDADAGAPARSVSAKHPGRFRFVCSRFSAAAKSSGLQPGSVDGIVIDAGITDFQATSHERGFCLKPLLGERPANLDMRMSKAGHVTGADLLAAATREELLEIMATCPHDWQGERAEAVVDAFTEWRDREGTPCTTHDIIRCVESVPRCVGGNAAGWDTRAAGIICRMLHMFVNGDLAELVEGTAAALRLLQPGGTLAVLSFKKLEWLAVRAALVESDMVASVMQVRPTEKELARTHTSRSATLWVVTKRLTSAQRAAAAALCVVAASIDYVRVSVRLRSSEGLSERSGNLLLSRAATVAEAETEVEDRLWWCWPKCGVAAADPGHPLMDLPTDATSAAPVLVFAEKGRAAVAARAETLMHLGRPLPPIPPSRAIDRLRRDFRRWVGPRADAEPFHGGVVLAPCTAEHFFDARTGFAAALQRSALASNVECVPGAVPPHLRVRYDGEEFALVPSAGWTGAPPPTPLALLARTTQCPQKGLVISGAGTGRDVSLEGLAEEIVSRKMLLGIRPDADSPPSQATRDRIGRHVRECCFDTKAAADSCHVFPFAGGVLVGPVGARSFFGPFARRLQREFAARDVSVQTAGMLPHISVRFNSESVIVVPCARFSVDGIAAELQRQRAKPQWCRPVAAWESAPAPCDASPWSPVYQPVQQAAHWSTQSWSSTDSGWGSDERSVSNVPVAQPLHCVQADGAGWYEYPQRSWYAPQ